MGRADRRRPQGHLRIQPRPSSEPLDKATIARYVGEKVSTSIRRNSYCRVAGKDWWLSNTEAIEHLAPNDYKVDAYYLTDEEGEITDMYIYQGDMLIDRLEDIGTYNTARAEQTEEDERIFTEQRKKLSHFNRYVKEHAIARVGVQRIEPIPYPGAQPTGGADESETYEIEEPDCVAVETDTYEYSLGEDYGSKGAEAV